MGQEGEKVLLYIYDLSQGMARQLSTTFLGKTIDGVWHTGVGLYGREYFYGVGIQSVHAGQSPFGAPVEVAELGYTHIPRDIFEQYLQEIGPRYTMETYSLLSHNCNNFSDEAAQFLVGAGIPPRILRQAEEALNNPLGAMMLPMFQQLETTLRYGGVPVAPQQMLAAGSFAAAALPLAWPNPSAPAARSTSRVAMTRGLSPSPPYPCPPAVTTTVAAIPPAVSPACWPDPAAPPGSDQRRGEREKPRDIDASRET